MDSFENNFSKENVTIKQEAITKQQLQEEMTSENVAQMYASENASVPNLNNLTLDIINVLTYINSDEMIELSNKDKKAFHDHVEAKFPAFSSKFYGLFDTLLDNKTTDIQPLIEMLTTFKSTSDNKLDSDFEDYRESMASKFIYPQFGGKEGYELALYEEHLKNKKKEKKTQKKIGKGHK